MILGISESLICKTPTELSKHMVVFLFVCLSQSPAYLVRYRNSFPNLEITICLYLSGQQALVTAKSWIQPTNVFCLACMLLDILFFGEIYNNWESLSKKNPYFMASPEYWPILGLQSHMEESSRNLLYKYIERIYFIIVTYGVPAASEFRTSNTNDPYIE